METIDPTRLAKRTISISSRLSLPTILVLYALTISVVSFFIGRADFLFTNIFSSLRGNFDYNLYSLAIAFIPAIAASGLAYVIMVEQLKYKAFPIVECFSFTLLLLIIGTTFIGLLMDTWPDTFNDGYPATYGIGHLWFLYFLRQSPLTIIFLILTATIITLVNVGFANLILKEKRMNKQTSNNFLYHCLLLVITCILTLAWLVPYQPLFNFLSLHFPLNQSIPSIIGFTWQIIYSCLPAIPALIVLFVLRAKVNSTID